MYEKYSILCNICAILCVIWYILTPEKGLKVSINEVSAKEAQTATGKTKTEISLEIPTGGKEDRKKTESGHSMDRRLPKSLECNAECKISELSKKGIRDEIARSLVTNCKELANNPVLCIKIGASIVKNESGGGYKCRAYNKYNCFGIQVKNQYKSYNDGVLHFIGKYNKYWHKAQNMAFFYSPTGSLPPSRYCISEHSSNTAIGCPTGLKISSGFFNSLSFK